MRVIGDMRFSRQMFESIGQAKGIRQQWEGLERQEQAQRTTHLIQRNEIKSGQRQRVQSIET